MLEDDVDVVMTPKKIIIGDPPKFIIGDCSSQDTVLHEGVSKPDDYVEFKYNYNGTIWELNPNFIETED